MKSLESLNNVEKGKLLHQLFPAEIAAAIQFIDNMGYTILEDEQSQRSKWNNPLFTFDFWLSLIRDVQQKIKKYGKRLETSSSLFADQLFGGYTAMYTIYCLTVYVKTQQHPNPKFSIAVDLLFNP